MNCHCIPFNDIPHTTRLFTDYLYNFSRVSEFYAYPPFEDDSFLKAARAIQYEAETRRQVVAVLREQNQSLSASDKTRENLSKLEDPACVAVVTGNQPGLFSGPAFTIYKGLSAIKTAEHLSSRGLLAVPVFWVATEDHDLAEVNHCFVQDRAGNPQRLSYTAEAPVEGSPVGAIPLTDEILPLLETLRAMLPDSASGEELLATVAECYQPGKNFGTAFGQMISRLFAEFGMVLLDPMDSRLHNLCAGIFQTAIDSAPAILSDLIARNQRLAAAGYHHQVHVSDSSSLLFVVVDGQRRALRLRDGRFVTAQGDSYSPQELRMQLERHPETLSANVLLRPIMQDALLPTVAYVGGPSELAYMAQAGAVYHRILGRMPVMLPRASITILDGVSHKLLSKYGLTLVDVLSGKQALRDRMAARLLPSDLSESFRKATVHLDADLHAIQASLANLDRTLVDAAAHSASKMHYQLSTLEHKAATAVQHRTDQIERDALRLENNLFPAKTQQERLYSGISLLSQYGQGFLHELYEHIPRYASQHQLMEL